MAKKKKRAGAIPDEPPAPKPPGPVGTSLKDLLKGVKPAPPPDPKKAKAPPPPPPQRARAVPVPPPPSQAARPSETLRGHDRTAFLDALAGVRPMRGRAAVRIGAVAAPPSPPKPEEAKSDSIARAKLTALVAGGVRFDVHREEDWIEGLRRDAKPAVLQALRRAVVGSEATIDLHGQRAAEAEARVARFIRDAHRAGLRRVLVICGRGLHSEHGVGVLGDVVTKTLTEGAAAPFTIAFVTAPTTQGGPGALLVELTKR